MTTALDEVRTRSLERRRSSRQDLTPPLRRPGRGTHQARRSDRCSSGGRFECSRILLIGRLRSVPSPCNVEKRCKTTTTKRQTSALVGAAFEPVTRALATALRALTRRRTGVRAPQRPPPQTTFSGRVTRAWRTFVSAGSVRVRALRSPPSKAADGQSCGRVGSPLQGDGNCGPNRGLAAVFVLVAARDQRLHSR